MKKRNIKHNNLLPWFTDDHGTLPASYLASCEEFFKWLEDCKRNGFQAPSSKRQASSGKQQALDTVGFSGKKIIESEE